ncbi:N-acetylglucosamine-1-phosphotransferase subunit gamma [Gossypium arboreum]|uniref:N-acetylglucosamine-1-phosphotransferase subunit gamma n=1 Tax=Gossypium arboreum TaxID=29729 RepID=A0A0B0MHG7_GOSAR|nr:N-acetylglucosamine-1-phosphotransferase subunit gamma [Gossypium arboreum]
MSGTWSRNENSYKTIFGIWHRCEIACKATFGTWRWHLIVCMIIPSILSIPNGSTGSSRVCQRNVEV